MPKRGSVQFLLLSLSSRAKLGLKVGMAVALALVLGALQGGEDFRLMERTGLAKELRQSAWKRALAGQTQQTPWPWQDKSFVAATNVPRLGLSAAILKGDVTPSLSSEPKAPSGIREGKPETELSNVEVGDRITVTGANGSFRTYRVTGRRVIDPHLAETDEPNLTGGEVTSVTCWPLGPLVAGTLRLFIQATEVDQDGAPEPDTEQKL
jgi:hypothetical protein